MIDPGRTSRSAEEGPGEGARPGPSVLPGSRGGNAAHDYKRTRYSVPTKQKGRRGRWLCAPTHPEEEDQ